MASRFHRHLIALALVVAACLSCTGAVQAGRSHVLLATTRAPAFPPSISPKPQPKPSPTPKPSPPQPPTSSKSPVDQYLAPQNQARAAVGVAALRWSAKLAKDASLIVKYQKAKKQCGFADLGASPYGANQAWASYVATPADAVRSWVDEGKYYNYANNACAAGRECGVYTQVVWRATREVGCAQASCGRKGPTLTICLYYPHGNVQGQKPY